MYQDKDQWGRLIIAVFNAGIVLFLIQPAQIEQAMRWSHSLGQGAWLPLTQLTLYVVSIGLILPKTKKLEVFKIVGNQAKVSSDWQQLVIGFFLNAAAWFMCLL